MLTMKVFSSERFSIPLPKGHKFPMAKYKMLRDVIYHDSRFELIEAPPIDIDLLKSVHDENYVEKVIKGNLSLLEIRDLGFPWSTKLVDRSLYSTGSTLAAVGSAIKEKASCTLAGGTHHAAFSKGYGFCVFNDIAAACHWVRERYPLMQIIVVDTDVHQGDGTATMVSENPNVLTVSFHANSNFPPKKACSDFDFFLPTEINDHDYLKNFESGLYDVLNQKNPELIIFVSGADIFKGDRLGRLSISKEAIDVRDKILFKQAKSAGASVATLMAGGYSNDTKDIVDIHFSTVKNAYEFWLS